MYAAISAAIFLGTVASDDFCAKQLDRQLAWHRHYGLPLPPPNASLVWYVTHPTSFLTGEGKKVTEPGSPGLGFSLDGRAILDGVGRSKPVASITCVKPDPSLVRDDVSVSWLSFAVVCHERGWKPLALAAIRKWTLIHGCWDTEDTIARDAWHHWKRRIHEDPGTPLSVLAKYLKRIRLNERDEELIRSIDLAAKPHNSAPGSDKALIDELVELSGEQPFDAYWAHGFRRDPRYEALAKRGLNAVPALIAHLEDERITRAICRREGLENIQNLRVKDIALDILAQLNGGPFVTEKNAAALVKAVGEWFAEADKLGEGKYLASRILGADDKDDEFRPTLFWLLQEKHPERLPDVFRALIDTRPHHRSFAWRYTKAIADGPLPAAEKRTVLEYAAIQDHAALRGAGIYYLRPFDPKLARGRLLRALAESPPTDPDTALVLIAAEGTDRDEWKALALAVRRADPETRLRLLSVIARADTPAAHKHRLAFLSSYLTDDAEHADERGWHLYTPAHNIRFPKLEVRNLAAIRIALLLNIDAEVERDWTTAQWAALREKVIAKAKEELRR